MNFSEKTAQRLLINLPSPSIFKPRPSPPPTPGAPSFVEPCFYGPCFPLCVSVLFTCLSPTAFFLSLRWLLREWVGHRCVAYQGRRGARVNGPLDPTVSIGVLLPVDPTLQNTSASLYDAGLRAKAPPPEPSRPPCLENGNEHFFPQPS